VFASDALSSVAYAPNEILLTLAFAGVAADFFSPLVGLCVVFVMFVVILSYRQNVHAYPSGGGDYEVVSSNLGSNAGLVVGSALFVDYILTVAVSVSSGTSYLVSMIPSLHGKEVGIAVFIVILISIINLRGIKESGSFFAIPVYMFIFFTALVVAFGFIQYFTGTLGSAPSAAFDIVPSPEYQNGLVGFAGIVLVARAFASGTTALTGIEAISNGVPSFEKPKSKNAATTLFMLGCISVFMLMSILILARLANVKYVEDPAKSFLLNGQHISADYLQLPTIGQLAKTVFSGAPIVFYAVSFATGLILFLAANTAFNGFPILGSILAKDRYMPKYMRIRGNRLAYSNGIIILAIVASLVIILFKANVTALIQLYVVGVFVSFTLSQFSMILHWTKKLKVEKNKKTRRKFYLSRVVNTVGFILTFIVLVVVLVTKFVHGAYITVIAIIFLCLLMKSLRAYYAVSEKELSYEMDSKEGEKAATVSRVHAIILVSDLTKATARAIGYARITHPSTIEALIVNVDSEQTKSLQDKWIKEKIPVPLRILASPYREITRPVLSYIESIKKVSQNDLVVVYMPEIVDGHWRENLLHNQTALRLSSRLRFLPGVVIASVPWQLSSAKEISKERKEMYTRYSIR
jgi:amino acid transporter